MPTAQSKPKLAIWKFSSCDGCQLSLLDCEDELVGLIGAVEIAYFLEASAAQQAGPYDLSLVEGSITTAHDVARIKEVRQCSHRLVTIGACATAGGIQALRNFKDVNEFISIVYARPDYIETLATSTPISAHVAVDYELHGCPINKAQLLEVVSAHSSSGASRSYPPIASAWSASCAAMSVSWSRMGRLALAPSPMPDAGRSVPLMIAAAMAAMARWKAQIQRH